MVATCANPECSAPFRHLRQGQLFVIDPRNCANGQQLSSGPEFFWLCGHCASRFTLTIGPGRKVACVARAESVPMVGVDRHVRYDSAA